ncbi:retrograde regulation protein 2 [Aspergillus homomorphus CBS 101889]|uniref:Retrograde regulation protein 2 n=1 Tax=Aspergillus homomorphus (strain CBS 101889) TaxID=1450537 RepID=A0A395IAR1_ASPHC|nr:retrograde regulation protein 2 [Aspergillus homomorphus CBS 101889]RAL17267.1 retrograde regulation protein 2 [Aspergillus homomorphus CBS 101889]
MAETPTPNPELYGIVDMGSNGIRFSITDLSPPTARIMPIIYQDRAGISLYDAQFSGEERGPIPPAIIEQVVDRLVHFRATCNDFCVPDANTYVLATEATRTAPNSEAFRARIRAATGWDVRLLSKEDEGRIGALGIASSAASVAGIAMDLGGGSTQITWVLEEDGVVTTSPKGSFSFPYGAAALSRLLAEAQGRNGGVQALKEEMVGQFREAYNQLGVPESLSHRGSSSSSSSTGFNLYLCGGGFRGWGYVLMKAAALKSEEPYPIPIINGFRVRRADFDDTVSVLDLVGNPDADGNADASRIYGVSKRRASQIPAVAVLVDVIMAALPDISHIQFCQGGVREGFLYDRLPTEVRALDPLLAATRPYAPPSAQVIASLLQAALPATPSPIAAFCAPPSFSRNLLAALANLLYVHAKVPRESRAAAALHSTSTGILAATNCLSHVERALIALVLCERWEGDLAPTDEVFYRQLRRCVSKDEAWWCRYLGGVAAIIGDVYPAGREPEAQWRVRFETEWSSVEKKKGDRDVLRLKVRRGDAATSVLQEILKGRAEDLEKVGKKKNWVHDHGVKVKVDMLSSV